jgi:hypothetical protein
MESKEEPKDYNVICPYCNKEDCFAITQHTVDGTDNYSKKNYKVKKMYILKCAECHKFLSIIPHNEVDESDRPYIE